MELKTGIISQIVAGPVSKNDWTPCDVIFSDGVASRILVPPTLKNKVPKAGDSITCKVTKNGLVLDDEQTQSYQKDDISYGTASLTKLDYEKKERDPKIELQQWATLIGNLYVASIPHFKNPPSTPDEVNDVIDKIFTKTLEIKKRVSVLLEVETKHND